MTWAGKDVPPVDAVRMETAVREACARGRRGVFHLDLTRGCATVGWPWDHPMTLWTIAVYANVFPTYWTERGMRRFDGRIVFMDPAQALRRSEVPLFLDDPDLIALAERRSAERAGRHGERPGARVHPAVPGPARPY